jgi:hypothetical protein
MREARNAFGTTLMTPSPCLGHNDLVVLFPRRIIAMLPPRLKTLETCARATGSAFGFSEADFETRYVPPVSVGRVAALMLALGGGAAALAHHFGWTQMVASLGWRSSV